MQAVLQEALSREAAALCCGRAVERRLALALRACLLQGQSACWGRQQLPAAPGAAASALAGQSRGRDVGPFFFPQTAWPFPRRGREKWWFVFKNTSVPRALCDSFNAFFSQAVSLAPGCFQPHSLLWDLSLLGPWLQQRLYCIFISQVPFWF